MISVTDKKGEGVDFYIFFIFWIVRKKEKTLLYCHGTVSFHQNYVISKVSNTS